MTYYQTIKDIYFLKPVYIKLDSITVYFSNNSGSVNMEKKNKAKDIMKKVLTCIENGYEYEYAFEKYQNIDGLSIYRDIILFDEDSSRTEHFEYDDIKTQAETLNTGEISEIIEFKNSYCILKCLDKKNKEYRTYYEAKEKIRSKYIDQKYEEKIKQMVSNANVLIVHNIYKSIKIED